MKLKWEPADIIPGMQVKKPGTMGRGCIVGYEVGFSKTRDKTLSFVDLNDGMLVFTKKDAFETAEHLTAGEYVPIDIVGHFEGDN